MSADDWRIGRALARAAHGASARGKALKLNADRFCDNSNSGTRFGDLDPEHPEPDAESETLGSTPDADPDFEELRNASDRMQQLQKGTTTSTPDAD